LNTDQVRESRKFWVVDLVGMQVSEEDCIKSLVRKGHWHCPKYNIVSIEGSKFFSEKALAVQMLQWDATMRLRKATSDYEKAFSITS
jgi:hypothetical protein